jgi:type II secretory pathway component PulC
MVPAAGPALKLTGIILMGDSNGGYAMLGEQGKPTRLYRVGADPPGHESLRLHAVYRDRVVMEVAGRLETVRLRMERPSPHVAMMTAASEQLPAGSQGAAPEFPGQTQALVPDAAETAFGELYVDRDAVSDQGMLIHPDKHYQRQFGLHDGDRVTQVDGVQITDPAALDEALRSANGSLSLTITRDGVEQTVSVPVNN